MTLAFIEENFNRLQSELQIRGISAFVLVGKGKLAPNRCNGYLAIFDMLESAAIISYWSITVLLQINSNKIRLDGQEADYGVRCYDQIKYRA